MVPVPPIVIKNDSRTMEEIRHYLYEENAFENIVISPGPGSPSRPEDVGIVKTCLLLFIYMYHLYVPAVFSHWKIASHSGFRIRSKRLGTIFFRGPLGICLISYDRLIMEKE